MSNSQRLAIFQPKTLALLSRDIPLNLFLRSNLVQRFFFFNSSFKPPNSPFNGRKTTHYPGFYCLVSYCVDVFTNAWRKYIRSLQGSGWVPVNVELFPVVSGLLGESQWALQISTCRFECACRWWGLFVSSSLGDFVFEVQDLDFTRLHRRNHYLHAVNEAGRGHARGSFLCFGFPNFHLC